MVLAMLRRDGLVPGSGRAAELNLSQAGSRDIFCLAPQFIGGFFNVENLLIDILSDQCKMI